MKNAQRGTLYRRAACKTALALGICLACGLPEGNARAQVVTIDPAHIAKDVANFAKTLEQYAKDIAQYQAVLQHYQQQLISMTQMNFSLPTMQNTYQEISDSDAQQQVMQACPSADGSGLGGAFAGLLQIFTPDVGSSITANQRKICEQIQFRQIDKYNLTIKMMNRLRDYSSNLKSLSSQLDSVGTSQGAMDGVKGNIEANSLALETEMKTWNSQVLADDQMISYLQNQQGVQARILLNGSNTLLGNVVQASTFAAAFH